MEMGGLTYREIPGDFSHIPEFDRPPRFVLEGWPANTPKAFDRGAAREPVKKMYPGKDIALLKGTRTGRVAILFNGPSMGAHDLHRIKVPIIGMNRTYAGYSTYKGPQPDYLCVVDHLWLEKPEVKSHPYLINGSTHKKNLGYRVVRHPRMAPFSFDLAKDGYVSPIPCTTGHLALQTAVYLGFTELYCLGWDLKGGHFDGTAGSLHLNQAKRYHSRQAPLLKERGVSVFLCGSPDSAIDFWPHAEFGAVCA